MEILVIDGQGGGLGRQLVAAVKKAVPQAVVTAIGTNSAATSAMLKAGADRAATGENAVVVGCRRADVILGPIPAGRNHPRHGAGRSPKRCPPHPDPRQPVRYPGGWGERPHRHPGGAGRCGRAGRLPELRQHRIKIHKNKMQKISRPPAGEHDTFCISIIKAISSCHLPYGAACTRMLGASAPQGRFPAGRLILL